MKDKKIIIKDAYERVVIGEVYIPGQVDTQGSIMTAEEIKKSAYDFMRKQRLYNVDMQHNNKATGSYVVESFIARANDPDGFVEGAWVAATKIESDEVWEMVLKGELNGYSLAGSSDASRKVDLVEVPVEASGVTQRNLDDLVPPHSHGFSVKFDDNLKVIRTVTEPCMGHSHDIISNTCTEDNFGHSHRYALESN